MTPAEIQSWVPTALALATPIGMLGTWAFMKFVRVTDERLPLRAEFREYLNGAIPFRDEIRRAIEPIAPSMVVMEKRMENLETEIKYIAENKRDMKFVKDMLHFLVNEVDTNRAIDEKFAKHLDMELPERSKPPQSVTDLRK